MSKKKPQGFPKVLQHSFSIEDQVWTYNVPELLHPSTVSSQDWMKSIALKSDDEKQEVVLDFLPSSANRAVSSHPLDRFISISFEHFRLRVPKPNGGSENNGTQPATARESSDYVVKLLRAGVGLNGVHYNFYGHSNSQLKSRTCFLFADTKTNIREMVESLGDFSKMKTVAKKAKRIALLFSSAHVAKILDPARCQDIPDIETNDYIFTDGCGLISPHLARELAGRLRIIFRNARYTPSVFQIRYRGYKGVLMLDPGMKGESLAKFRKSMKKFSGGDDYSFSVVDYSKPYRFGHLNDEMVLPLHALGIPESVLLRKQAEFLKFLADASTDPLSGFRFLTYVNEHELAEKLLMTSIEEVTPRISKLVNKEYEKMLKDKGERRCRILIPKSRLLFGICDAWDVLREGECAVKVTMDGDGIPRALTGMEILVTRNPSLHPGDLQKFRVVERPELSHLVDCIVFSTRGRRPAADLMSGGDLDGDMFFVCWDRDLIPEKMSEPALYPGGKEPVVFKPITDDDRLVYFAKYTNASLGRAKRLYLDWARSKGPMSAECQELNRLFSTCVDGINIKIPSRLDSSPQPPPDKPFILDTLHNAAKDFIQSQQTYYQSCEGYTFDAMELLLSRDNVAMSEFELVKLTYRWCQKNKTDLMDFLYLFDVNLLTAEEKAWLLSQLPVSVEATLIMNALCQSNLIQTSELHPFKLDYPGLRWKCVYDSTQDRLATFLDAATRTLELFHRKLIVVRVDERLTLAIYVPQKIEAHQECQVDNRVRLFAFPHSQGEETTHHLALPTKMNYRIYCDNNVFQLFERQRSNSWVFLTRAASDDSSYRNIETKGGRRRCRQATIDSGINFDCRASIALDKFSRDLQKHIGRVNRSGVLGAEIYVISNRDVKTMKILDLWLEYIDTIERMPLFEENAKEYSISKLADVDWSLESDFTRQLARDKDYSVLDTVESEQPLRGLFLWLLEKGETGLLLDSYQHIINQLVTDHPGINIGQRVQTMLDFLKEAPFLSIKFARLPPWKELPIEASEVLENSSYQLLEAYILCANDMQEFVVEPFQKLLSQIKSISLENFSNLIELMSLTVHFPEIALNLIFDCLSPETSRILSGNPKVIEHFVRNLFGIALDHIDEAEEALKPRRDFLSLKCVGFSDGYSLVECQIRIDAPGGFLGKGDHVRLKVASRPTNSPMARLYSTDALVESTEHGSAKFRCFHPLPSFVEDCSWELQSCGPFVTTKTVFDAVRKLGTLPEVCGISDYILGTQIRPHNNNEPTTPIAIKSLNPSQNRAVEIVNSHPVTCLWGPPGTGKTHTIVEIIKQLQLSEKRRILVTAPTHNAVDNVMEKYLENLGTEELASRPLPLRVSTDVRRVADNLKKYTCDAMAGKEIYTSYAAFNKALDQVKKSRLVFTTCAGSGLGILRSQDFDTVIIDEASQQTEPASLVPLVKKCTKAILVGDHVQLGAVVQRHAVLLDFNVSLFERLYKQDSSQSHGIAKVMLDTQYRMHESICRFSSKVFYEDRLQTNVPNHTRPLHPSKFPWPAPLKPNDTENRMVFVECSTKENALRKSKVNEGQVSLCHRICCLLRTTAEEIEEKEKAAASVVLEKQSIAVLTPYSGQVELLKTRLSALANVEVSSIDGFQGREAEIVIFVTVRCNEHSEIGFLKDLRRMNVALTRARTGVIVIGHRLTLTTGKADPESTEVWKSLMSQLVKVPLGLE